MSVEFEPGDRIKLNDDLAEVIRAYEVGDLPYLRVYVEGEGAKTVCVEHVSIEPADDALATLDGQVAELHPRHEAVSSEWFDLRTNALQLKIAHEQGQLLSISNSLVRLEPYQLACVNQVMQKLRQRVLIGDDVGLGKTIEAGLILKELQARNRANSVLFLVPAHLQKKWIRDMERFFGIDLTVADRQWVEAERRRLGEETNIWDQEGQSLVTSMAFLRQDEFQSEIEDAFWDVVIIDEAHKASKRGDSPSKTSLMAERVANRSESLLLLSATPHDGKGEAFRSLISYIDPFLVAENQELTRDVVDRMMIRRGKQTIYDDNGERIFPDRDVQTVTVSMSPAEEELYERVTEYVREIYNRSDQLNEPAVGFAMALMQKRLVSSVGAIRETLRRRLQGLLEPEETGLSTEASAYLDGEDLDESDLEQAEKELERLTVARGDDAFQKEIKTLRELVALAEDLPVDTKARKVKRYIEQLFEEEPDEKLLLFTEYRDTLDYLLDLFADEPWADEILTIHGDVSKDEREQIEDEFNYGQSRLLLATDAASEGIDLQHKCHIMVNYELPWNPNRLEQRIGRIHRYGQEKEVKVWNFQFDGTRESEIFDLLQEKVEEIRSKVGSTADVLGMLDDINMDSLLMKSVQNNEPASATKDELEELMEEREQTLLEWYERSLIDPSTFDAESREEIQEIVDESEDVFGSEQDIREFFTRAIEAFGGSIEKRGNQLYEAEVPPEVTDSGGPETIGPFTFNRDYAIEHEGIEYLSPDSEILQSLRDLVLQHDQNGGKVGLKLLPFVDQPGITFVYKVAFEDATGETIREQLIPVYVDLAGLDAQRSLGERVLETDSVHAKPDRDTLSRLLSQREELESAADRYISSVVADIRGDILDSRKQDVKRELEDIEEYEQAERERIQSFIESYEEKASAGSDMRIAIRNQEQRLEELETRIEKRKTELRKQEQVISLAPDIMAYCLSLPV
jgi:SNF2 family DNA or RNA helicase